MKRIITAVALMLAVSQTATAATDKEILGAVVGAVIGYQIAQGNTRVEVTPEIIIQSQPHRYRAPAQYHQSRVVVEYYYSPRRHHYRIFNRQK